MKPTVPLNPFCLHSRSRSRLPWFIFLLSATLPLLCWAQDPAKLQSEEEEEKPTCIFSGIVWQGASINGLGYFPEGKEEDEFIEVFLPNGGRSRKYAYYGTSPLTFYNRIEIEKEDEGKPDAPSPPKKEEKPDEEDEKEIKYVPAASAKLEPDKKEIFIFFFKNTGENSEYNLRSIDFSPETFPAGSYWFFSRCKTPLSIQFGLDKGQLAALGQAKIKARPDEFGDLPIRVFQEKTGIRRKVYSTIWNLNPQARTIVFMLPTPNGVNVRRFMDLVKDEEALGLRQPKNQGKEVKPSKP